MPGTRPWLCLCLCLCVVLGSASPGTASSIGIGVNNNAAEGVSTVLEALGSPVDQPLTVLAQLRCSEPRCSTIFVWDDLEVMRGTVSVDGYTVRANATYFPLNGTVVAQAEVAGNGYSMGAAEVSLAFAASDQRVECTEIATTAGGDGADETASVFHCRMQDVKAAAPFIARSLSIHAVIASTAVAPAAELVVRMRTPSERSPSILRVFTAPAQRILYARSVDSARNWEKGMFVLPVEVGLPRPELLSSPPAICHSNLAHFEVRCALSDPRSECVLQFQLDGHGPTVIEQPDVVAEVTLSGLSDGEHHVILSACTKDVCTEAEWHWTIDTSEPDTVLEVAPPTLATSQEASFIFASDKSGVHFMCNLDGAGEWLTCGETFSFQVQDGLHVLKVAAVDMAGRVDATPVVYQWFVDTFSMVVPPCPEEPVSMPFHMYLLSTFNGHECVGCVYQVRLDQETFLDIADDFVLDGLAPGQHEVTINATSADGFTSSLQPLHCTIHVVDGATNDTSEAGPVLVPLQVPARVVITSSVPFEFSVPHEFTLYCLLVHRNGSSQPSDTNTWEPCPASFELQLPDGQYTLFVKAAKPGLELPLQWFAWHQRAGDTILSLVTSPPASSEVPTAKFAFAVSPDLPSSELWYSLDNQSWARIWGSQVLRTLTLHNLCAGAHHVEFVLKFPGTGVSSTLSYSWVISFAYPATELSRFPPLLIPNTTVSLALECYVNGSVSNCDYEYRIENAHTVLPLVDYLPVIWYPTQQSFVLHHLMEGNNTIFVRSVQPGTQVVDHSPKAVVVRVDTTPPEVTIIAVSLTSSGFIWVSFGCSEEGCIYQALSDPKERPMVVSNPYHIEATTSDFVMAVRAKDEAGNVGDWKNVSAADLQTFLDSSIHFLATPPKYTDANEGKFLVRVNTEGLKNAVVSYILDGQTLRTSPATDEPTDFTLEDLQEGKHTFQVVLKSSNRPTSAKSFSWTVVWQAPRLTLAEYPPVTTHLGSAFFEMDVKGSDNLGVLCDYALDHDAWTTTDCRRSLRVNDIGAGVHVMKIRARNVAPNAAPVSVSHAWMVHNNDSMGPPSRPFQVAAKATDRAALVSWNNPSDDGGRPITRYIVVAVSMYGSTPIYRTDTITGKPCPTQMLFQSLLNNVAYTFYVFAENELGISDRSRMSNSVTPGDSSNPCALKSCSEKGSCMLTRSARGPLVPHCVCRPGYTGGNCETKQRTRTYGIVPASWTNCNSDCGGGTRHRDLPCYEFHNGDFATYYPVDDGFCEAERATVAGEEICGENKCGLAVLRVEMQLHAAMMDVGFSDSARRAFAENVFLEVSYALNIATERLHTFNVKRVDSGHILISFDVTTGTRDTELTLETVYHLLNVHISTRGSVLRSTGTWMRLLVPETASLELDQPGSMSDYSLALGVIQTVAVIGLSLFLTSAIVLCHHSNPKRNYRSDPSASICCTLPCSLLWRCVYGCMRMTPPVVRYGELSSEDDELQCFTDSPSPHHDDDNPRSLTKHHAWFESDTLIGDQDL